MIIILYILFKRNQKKADRERKDWKNARLEALELRLEDSLNQSKDSSEESNLEPKSTEEKVFPKEKNSKVLEELERQPVEIQYSEIRIHILLNDVSLEKCSLRKM